MIEFAKITERHRPRRAVVYVRQSTPGQVERNTESAARQYALAERAVELGWPVGSVLVVDEDTGLSGRWAHARIGFRELAAEVGLGHVGVILALEVSRLARSSADWHQLLDLCALTGTLIADADGIYSPAEFNDRLLLGLKGTMSEAELHLIRSRLRGGLENKAARGELQLPLPIGLERDEDGEIRLCVDEQVRGAIRRVFELWDRCGSGRQVVAELAADGQRLPRRRISERRIRWEPPDYGAAHEILTNPNYAGAYAYGRHLQVKTVDEARARAVGANALQVLARVRRVSSLRADPPWPLERRSMCRDTTIPNCSASSRRKWLRAPRQAPPRAASRSLGASWVVEVKQIE